MNPFALGSYLCAKWASRSPKDFESETEELDLQISILEDRVVQIVSDDSGEVTVEGLEVELGLKSISAMTSSGQQTKAPINPTVQNILHRQPSHFISNSDKSNFLHRQPSHFTSNSDKRSQKGGWDPPCDTANRSYKGKGKLDDKEVGRNLDQSYYNKRGPNLQPNKRNNFSKNWRAKRPFFDPCASYRSPVLHANKFDPLIAEIDNAGEPRPTPITDDFPSPPPHNYPSDADD